MASVWTRGPTSSLHPQRTVLRVNPTASSKEEPRPSKQPMVCFVWGDVENLNAGFLRKYILKSG